MACSSNFHWRYLLKKMLFSDIISFDPCIFHKSGIISADISRNWKVEVTTFFFKSTYFWSSRLQMFFKVGVLKSYAIFTGKHLRWSHFWIKFQSFRPATLKVTTTKVLFCEYCKIFKNSFFHRTPPVAASVTCKRRSLFQDMIWLFLSINSGL